MASKIKLAVPREEGDEMSDFLCIGDYICLYCEELEGYVFSYQSSSVHNGVYLYHRQDRLKPKGIPNPHAVVFQVCIANRYKLNKKSRKLASSAGHYEDLELKAAIAQAKAAADAENDDNIGEQKRQQGKRVRYGEIIQLKHVFTGKYIHVSTTQTSRRDKNNMMVFLQNYNAKHCQFRILPRYKVKSEGEVVQILDQITFESVKSPGQYFHASVPFTIDNLNYGSELNLGVDVTGFTVVKYYKPIEEQEGFLKGGSVIRLFHKELEAYLVAEGLFNEIVTEDVHLRIREVDQLVPKTLYPSSSGITFWQVEDESSILHGDVIRWEQQVRFRHMTTRLYLCLKGDMTVCLTDDAKDPNTVFRLHPIVKETDEIQVDSYTRIEHVLSGFWLHAVRDEEYKRKQMQGTEDDDSMRGLRWDGASLRKIAASGERMYHDAYTIQKAEQEDVKKFNLVAGTVPFLLNLIHDFEGRSEYRPRLEEPYMSPSRTSRNGASWSGPETQLLHNKRTLEVCTSLRELKDFMIVSGVPTKDRQKLMRNLRIIDLIVKLLKFPLQGAPDQANLCEVFKAAYNLLHTYMIGNSRKNALYFAKYIDFFQTQFHIKLGNIGLNVAQMIVELIRDNRKIVDRITRSQIDEFVDLLRENKNYRYLDLLSVLCVCDSVAIPDNQTYITENWLMKDQSGLFLTERGQNIRRQTNVVYVSPDSGDNWIPLHDFVNDKEGAFYNEDDVLFLEHQLDLFRKLCYGRNEFAIETISQELGYLSWEEAFLCLRLHLLPDALRAKYCDLIIGLFVDVGNNYSVLEYNNISFVYDDVDSEEMAVMTDFTGELVVKDLVTIFPVLRDWIKEFLDDNHGMVASHIGHNLLIEQVLRLLHYLVKYGYYGNARDIQELQKPLLNLLDGKNDLPFPSTEGVGSEKLKKHGYSADAWKLVEQYRKKGRYIKNPETTAIVNAKYQALEVMDLILTYQFSKRLRTFVSMFKQAERSLQKKKAGILQPLLNEAFDALDQNKKAVKEQKKMMKVLKDMFDHTAFFDVHELTTVLLDLTNYKYDKMVTKSLAVLNKYFSSKMDMFKSAVQAQVLITPDSCRVHKDLLKCLPVLRRLSKSKLNDQQVEKMSDIMDSLIMMCQDTDSEDSHPMNQSILINHEVMSLVFDNLSQEIDVKLMEQYRGIKTIVIKNIQLLKALAKGNDVVQRRIYERMDSLLKVKVVESEVALALKECFTGNQATCLKVQSKQIEKIVSMVGEHQHHVPELLEVLRAIVKVDSLDVPLKRNQAYVMKFIMQSYSKTANVLDQTKEVREKILCGEETENHVQYMTCLVDLLATCAEGENRFIESLCQTILPMEEILWVLNNGNITNHIKKPYLKYLHWVFMRSSASFIDTGAGELTHHSSLWRFIQCLTTDISHTTHYINNQTDHVMDLIKMPPKIGKIISLNDTRGLAHANIHFILDAVFPFLRTFFSKFYSVDKDMHNKEPECVNELAIVLQEFCESLQPYIMNPGHLKTMLASMTTVLTASTLKSNVIESFIGGFGSIEWFTHRETVILQTNDQYYVSEVELNHEFRIFAVNCSLLYGGHNTVASQLKHSPKWAQHREYTNIGSDEVLPLGEEFQDHIKCFLKTQEKKTAKQYELAGKIIEQLGISANHPRLNEALRLEQEDLNIKSLQLLRSMIHNEIVKLPDEWEDYPHKYKKQLQKIFEIQNGMADMGCVNNVLPLLARTNDEIVRESLAFMSVILFNANKHVQKTMIDYFKSIREEVFFLSVRNRMQLSTIAIKERRALAAQQEARIKEVMTQAKSLQSVMSVSRKAMQQIQAYENELKRNKLRSSKRSSLASLQFKASKQSDKHKDSQTKQKETNKDNNKLKGNKKRQTSERNHNKNSSMKVASPKQVRFQQDASDEKVKIGSNKTHDYVIHMENGSNPEVQVRMKSALEADELGEDNIGFNVEEGSDVPENGIDVEYKDEGYIELVLRVMGQMCDGQFLGLQDYLRDQPDNIKSFNIIAEVTSFLNMVYSNINSNTIDLVIQIFSALNEFASGNQPNRAVILTHKVVDYINFILRAEEFVDCSPGKVLQLRQVIGNLLYSMIEESGPAEMTVAKEVKDTLDKEALYRIMTKAYELHQIEKPKLDDLIQKRNITNIRGAIKSAKTLAKEGSKYMREVVEAGGPGLRESLVQLGFTYFFILQRFYDLDPKLQYEELLPSQEKAFKYYRKNSLSVEILKDEHLQKVNFRVKNKNVLREEVKEKLKWSVDRSSPSNKIRDMMMWSKDILKDIHYQRRILSNFFAAFLTQRWLWWNYGVIILSLVINVLMLITWEAPLSLGDLPHNVTLEELPPAIHDPNPKISGADFYTRTVSILGFIHNVMSLLVLVSYFLSNHPNFPSIGTAVSKCRQLLGKHEDDNDDEKDVEKHVSKLEVQFFSAKTFYYIMMFTLSLAGSFSQGYFFAFHLLNIVNNNQLLGGVIQAITQNGKSLLWVAVLGLVIFYLYAILGFAFFRDMFDPENYMYCNTLFECTVSLVRYGLIGDYDDMFKRHVLMNNFTTFAYMSIFNISFFIIITTIGLNIIFGIIVDTFSELRDLKWTAESDMRDTCFVCSRKSYDFEHHAQGFTTHVKYEHNMWAYIFFFIHLDGQKANNFTSLDLFVHNLLQQERYDFFPLNRALSLSLMDEDSTESKIDELLQYVLSLVHKQKEEESERKRQEERLQQRRWQELHRRTSQPNLQSPAESVPQDADAELSRMLRIRDTGKTDWVKVEFESTHL